MLQKYNMRDAHNVQYYNSTSVKFLCTRQLVREWASEKHNSSPFCHGRSAESRGLCHVSADFESFLSKYFGRLKQNDNFVKELGLQATHSYVSNH